MKVFIDRESVCAGDDIDSHDEMRRYEPQMKFGAVIEGIVRSGFLPEMSGPLAAWVVYAQGHPVAILGCESGEMHFAVDPSEELRKHLPESDARLEFRYSTTVSPKELFLDHFPKIAPRRYAAK